MKKIIVLIITLILIAIIVAILFLPKKAILIEENLRQSLFAQSNLLANGTSNVIANNRPFSNFKIEREIGIDLRQMKGFYFENNTLIKTFPVLSRASRGKWFQTPLGFFKTGIKKEKHLSSLFPVYMPYSIQYNEDFFIHAVPVYATSGERVPQGFTGGCIRLNDDDAKFLFEKIKTGDRIVVYETFKNFNVNPLFDAPVDLKSVWLRQDFNNPLRMFWGIAESAEDKKDEYYHHAGIDLAGWNFENLNVYNISDGKIAMIQENNGKDHGFGNTIIVEMESKDKKLYALYGHLDSIDSEIKSGGEVKKGQLLGKIGNSGYGCQNYWRVGEDGCNKTNPPDGHLHLEIKTAPILENPEGGEVCYNKKRGGYGKCFGYTPDNPIEYGYLDPLEFLRENEEETQL